MSSYLERYRAGEHEAVWSELAALGEGVFEEAVHGDALGVARETMRRARHNVELLIGRLDAMGYRFADAAGAAADAPSLDITAMSSQLAALGARSSGAARSRANSRLGALGAALATLGPQLEASRAEARKAASQPRKPPLDDARGADVAKLIAKAEGRLGRRLPLSLLAWYEEVGAVSLMGSHPLLNPADRETPGSANPLGGLSEILSQRLSLRDVYARYGAGANIAGGLSGRAPRDRVSLPDPLVIFPLEDLVDQLSEQEIDGAQGPVELMLAPDDLHKADISGDGYYITLSEPQADVGFGDWHKTTFVNYLRAVFQWGGFPGWARSPNPPSELIAELTQGLLPI